LPLPGSRSAEVATMLPLPVGVTGVVGC